MHDQLIAEGLADIAKSEAILRAPLTMPVSDHQLQNREWARGVLADAWIAAQQQERELMEKCRERAYGH